MKENFMDVLLLAAMYLGIYYRDYRPRKQQRSQAVNVCYLALLLLSAAVMTISLLPGTPKLMGLLAPLLGKAG